MENRTEKSSHKIIAVAPPKSAYIWLAGIFCICFAVIYIALLLRVNFLDGRGELVISDALNNVLFLCLLAFLLIALYLYIAFSRKELLFNLKEPSAILCVFTIVIAANIYLSYVSPYMMFMSLTALLALPFSKKRDAFILNIFSCLISAFVLLNTLDANHYVSIPITVIVGILSGAVASYVFPTAMTRVFSVLRAVVAAAVTIIVYSLLLLPYTGGSGQFVDYIKYVGIAACMQVLLTGVLVPIVESIFNITTDLKLVELTNHKAPLIRRLLVEAPGTFNHCLAVANFAEICADAIGEDPYLARACAYYHDIGKLNNAEYFAENQSGYNPHDEILPEVSAEIIRQHTVDGYELCKQNRIPEEVARITVEHHGTLPITYFYNKAKSLTDSEVDMEEYRYQGEIPTRKIGAIIMICDSAEAAIRAMDNPDGEKVDRLLKAMIDERLKLGQFDDCAITMKDLNAIRAAIVGAFGGLFHKRIKYNNGKNSGGAHV